MKLRDFLIREGVLGQYITNNENSYRDSLRDSTICTSQACFSWKTSPEGYDFWANLSHKYLTEGVESQTWGEVKKRRVKATNLAKRIYPDAKEKEGYLEI